MDRPAANWWSTAAAIGDRQMLPVQTKHTEYGRGCVTGGPFAGAASPGGRSPGLGGCGHRVILH
jgi:hypothetical protein